MSQSKSGIQSDHSFDLKRAVNKMMPRKPLLLLQTIAIKGDTESWGAFSFSHTLSTFT